jgi:hypothetical protein
MNNIIRFFNLPLLKIPLLFGLISGLLGFCYFLALYFMGIIPLGNNKVLDFGFFIILNAVCCWYYRKAIGKGVLHLWEGITIGYVINTFGSLVLGWLIYFFVTFIDPAVLTDYVAEMQNLLTSTKENMMKEMKMTEVDYQKLYKDVSDTTSMDLIMDELGKKTIMGVLPVLAIALIFRKRPAQEIN